jgi:hypothetical protein
MKPQSKTSFPILTTLILITLFILAILFIYISSRNQSISSNKTYYKCNDKHNPPLEHILDTGNYTRQLDLSQSGVKPDLYLPCGYGNAELELYKIPREQVANTAIFAIQGCDVLAGKDTLWQQLEKTYSREGAKTIMPETYLTNSPMDMELFKSSYKQENIYILKKNIQRKRGIIILNNLMNILDTIKRDPRYIIIQHYIPNPFLINQRKLNIRLYVSIICKPNTAPGAYLHPDGKCIYSNQDYNPKDIANLESHLTSLNLDVNVYSSVPHNLKQLEKYIGNNEYSIIWNKIVKKLGMVIRAVNPVICQDIKGTVNFQLFGVDVMLDTAMEPWILEFNKGPDMTYKTPMDKEIKQSVYEDLFQLVGLSDIQGIGGRNKDKWQKL